MTTPDASALLALDWGSSQLRAYRLGAQGRVLEQRASADGASRLEGGAPAFEAALRHLAGDWLAPGLPVLACGMVGSAHGWCEAPYVASPIGLDELHRHLVAIEGQDGLRVHIVPGVKSRDAAGLPDVMRGEETQLAGLLALHPALSGSTTVVMPGTHSKWVQLQAGRLQGFATRMTGELFALLRGHSVLARLMAPPGGPAGPAAPPSFDPDAFDRGVAAARTAQGKDLGRLLFSVRALGLFGELPAQGAADYLSGLLIGAEVSAGLQARGGQAATTVLVGEAALCARYARTLAAWGQDSMVSDQALAARGLWTVWQGGARSP